MSAVPLQSWNSGVKVINNNPNSITVYAQIVNFAPQGETGEGKFLPVFEKSTEGTTLAEWVTLSNEPVTIEPEKSYTFPFTIHVPQDAAPGGHFAAILIGTKPPEGEGVVKITTSQVVTSLLFVRVAGDVIENGVVREFKVVNSFVSIPKADFEVRFENKGNVHLQPQGEIVITNMWGKERGIIPINQQTHFGNVLPESIRKFEFSWNGEPSFSDIGRYKAILTLAYGDESKKFVTSSTYFYVIPVKATLIVLGSLLALILFVSWCIKAYVRRMLAMAGVDTEYARTEAIHRKSFEREGDVRIGKHISMRAPVQKSVLDLQQRLAQAHALFDKIKTLLQFMYLYRIFFGSAIVLMISAVLIIVFIHYASKEYRDYEIVINNPDTNVTLSSEDILYSKAQQNSEVGTTGSIDQTYDLILVNSSDTPGAAASLQAKLETKGFSVTDLQSDFEKSKETSVVVYDLTLQDEALALSKELSGALLSADPVSSSTTPKITIYIGNDYVSE